MRHITAKEKSFLHSLKKKKNRDVSALFLVENFLTISDAIQIQVYPEFVAVTGDFLKNYEVFLNLLEKEKVEIVLMENRDISYLSSLETSQGIVASYAKQTNTFDFTVSTVFLDGLTDPGNAGTVLRSASAFGIKNVVFGEGSVDPYNSKTVSAAKESIFLLRIFSSDEMLMKEIASRMSVYALVVQGGVLLPEVKWEYPFCLVVGSEAHGISKQLLDYEVEKISIPMETGSVESLNAGVSASIALATAYISHKKNKKD